MACRVNRDPFPMTQPQQGFVLSRHWRDTPDGTEVAFWLATDAGPRQVRLPCQETVAFIPAEQRAWAEPLLRNEKGVELRPLSLRDFRRRPVLGLYCRQYRQLLQLEKKLRQVGVDVYEIGRASCRERGWSSGDAVSGA